MEILLVFFTPKFSKRQLDAMELPPPQSWDKDRSL